MLQAALKIAPNQPSRIANTNGRSGSPVIGMRSKASRGRNSRSFTVATSAVVHGSPGCSHGITAAGAGGSTGGGGGGGQSPDGGNGAGASGGRSSIGNLPGGSW